MWRRLCKLQSSYTYFEGDWGKEGVAKLRSIDSLQISSKVLTAIEVEVHIKSRYKIK